MQATPQLHVPRPVPLAIGFAALAAGVGALAAYEPLLALLAVLAAAFVLLVLSDLTVGLLLFVGVSFLETIPGLIPGAAIKAMGMVLVLSWLATMMVRRRGMPSLLAARPWLVVLLTLFVLWSGTSLLWARSSAAVFEELIRYLPLFALFGIVHAAIRTRGQLLALSLVLIGGAMLAVTAGIASPPPPDAPGPNRLGTGGAGANALAPVLILGVMLAAAFAGMTTRTVLVRLAATAACCYCLAGMFLTGSRGGLVGLGVALLAGLFFAGRGRRIRVLPLVVIAVCMALLYILAIAPPIVRERISNPGDGTGRADIWKVGAEMVKANPVLGVGAGNFRVRSPQYVLEAGLIRRSDLIVDKPLVAHNIYLAVLSQLGIVGLLLFLGIIGASLAAAANAARAFTRQRDEESELLARAVVIALCGILAAGFFGSWSFSKPLWLLLATCSALLALSLRQSSQVPAEARPR
jgi:O-antigen ligase